MRRVFLIAIVALAVSAAALPATSVMAGDTSRVRSYEGSTSEGGRLRIGVLVSDGVARLSALLIDGPYQCEDGTEGQIETGVGWGAPGGPVLTDQHLELSDNWRVIAFSVSGRLGTHRGSGTLTFLLPGVTADEQEAQVCTMGELTWSVERTAGAASSLGRSPVRRLDDGRTVTMGLWASGPGEATTAAQAQTGPTRHYRGRTSMGHPMAAQTQRVDAGIELLALPFGFTLACEDGSENEGGFHQIIESPILMSPGRLDLDLLFLFGPGDVLHVHGDLDAHAGTGTLAVVSALITEDLDAQLCTSGEQTWELWRTDAGH
jgi:hypothetical protein